MAAKNHPVRIQLKAIDMATRNVQALKREFRSISVPVRRVNNQFKSLHNELKGITSLGDKTARSLKGIGSRLTVGATLPIGAGAVFSVKRFADLEQAAINVRKTTNLGLDEINSFVDDISRRTPLAQLALLEIAGAAGQLGVKGAQNIALFTETMGKLEKATDIVGEDGAKAIVRLLNVSGDGIGNMRQFSSALVDLGNNAAASESEILEMSTRVGLATAQFKLGSKNILGIAAAMKNVGIQAEAGGTVIGNTFLKIQSAILKGGSSMRALEKITKQSRAELRKTFKEDATSVFKSFIEGLARLKKEGKATTLVLEDFGLSGDRINAVIPTLAEGASDLASMIGRSTRAFAEGLALENEFAEQTKSLNSAFVKGGNVITRIARKVGAVLAPSILKAILLFERIEGVLDRNPGLTQFLFWAGAAVAVLGPLLVGLGFIVTGLTALAPVLALVASNFTLIASVGAYATTALGAFYLLRDGVMDFAKGFLSSFESVNSFFEDKFLVNLSNLGTAIGELFFEFNKLFGGEGFGLMTTIGKGVGGFFTFVFEFVIGIVNALAVMATLIFKIVNLIPKGLNFTKELFGFGPESGAVPSLGPAVGAKTVMRESVLMHKQQKEVRAVVDFGNVPSFAKVRSDGFDKTSVGFNRGQMMSFAGAN